MKQTDEEDRRIFLAKCGRFAVTVPPAMTALLSTSLTSDAIAHSGGKIHREHREHHDRKDD